MGRIDVHAHLLPGVDDGSRTIEESVAMAGRLVAAGYSHLFCTPHVWPNLDNTTVTIALRVAELQGHLDAESIPLTLLPGGEMGLAHLAGVRAEDLVTYGNGGRYVLFDFWGWTMPDGFEPGVQRLLDAGLQPILAHPERIEGVQKTPERVERMTERGLWLQGNLECIGEGESTVRGKLATHWLREGRYALLGTDLHRHETLDRRLVGLQRAADLVGHAELDRLTIEQPHRLMPAVF